MFPLYVPHSFRLFQEKVREIDERMKLINEREKQVLYILIYLYTPKLTC